MSSVVTKWMTCMTWPVICVCCPPWLIEISVDSPTVRGALVLVLDPGCVLLLLILCKLWPRCQITAKPVTLCMLSDASRYLLAHAYLEIHCDAILHSEFSVCVMENWPEGGTRC